MRAFVKPSLHRLWDFGSRNAGQTFAQGCLTTKPSTPAPYRIQLGVSIREAKKLEPSGRPSS